MTFAELIRYHRRQEKLWTQSITPRTSPVGVKGKQACADFHKRAADFLEAQAQIKEPPHA